MDRREVIKKSLLGLSGMALSIGQFKSESISIFNELRKAEDLIPDWAKIKSQFRFAEGLTYFNNASLGPCPMIVRKATDEFRSLLDEHPARYMWGGWSDEKTEVREKVAAFLNAETNEIALVHNTTEGMNAIAHSLKLKKKDEVILGNHEHRTATKPWYYWQGRRGVKIVRIDLSLIPENEDVIVQAYERAITKRTRVISIVHMTNTNGMILPIKKICEMAHQRNILVAVDGAQAIGTIKVDLKDLGCDFYAASAHKWLFSPKGMGVLYARKDRVQLLEPLIANHGYSEINMTKMEDYNTRNLPELLGLGVAIDFHREVGEEYRLQRLGELTGYFLEQLKTRIEFIIKTPLTNDQSFNILAVEKTGTDVSDLKDRLFDNHGIDVRPMSSHSLNALRISISIYHDESDIDYLIKSMIEA